MKNPKAPGIDQIHNRLIKKLPDRGIKYLTFIFCCCLKLAYFPTKWKTGNVFPIPKPGKNLADAISYIPISLLSSVSKLFERVILHRIQTHLEDDNILPDEQDGFRHYRSKTHQLVKTVEHIKEKLGQKSSTGRRLNYLKKKTFELISVYSDVA